MVQDKKKQIKKPTAPCDEKEVDKNKKKPAPPPAPNVNPISSATGGAPMAPPKTIIKIGDGSMAQAARDYNPGTAVI